MALIKELINILNIEDEPLQKRLKIADCAFTSNDVHLQSKETYLLNWIANITNNNLEAWKLFSEWLNSTHFKNLDKSDLSQDCIRKIYEVVWEKLNSNDLDIKIVAIDASLVLINSPIFQDYFKSNLENYFTLLCTVVDSTSDKNTLLKILKNENLFSKIYYTSDKFHKNFFKLLLPVLSEIDLKWNDSDIFLEICSLVQKHILRNNFKLCEDYLQQVYEEGTDSKHSILRHFFTSFVNSYNNSIEICPKMLQIFLHSLCSEYPNNFLFIYKLSVILFQIIGFNFSDKFNLRISQKLRGRRNFDKSLTVASIIFDALSTYKTELSLKVKDTTFSEFIQILVLTIINLAKAPNKLSFQIIYYCIDINPLVVDSIISEVLQYLLLKKNDCKTEYIQLITVIFKVFVKLHRIQNLVSKMFPVLRQQLLNVEVATAGHVIDFDGDIPPQSVTYEYNIEDIFPPEVLSSFSNCVTQLASWQIMNLFKTFLYHLTTSTDDIQDIIHDECKLIYIESIGIFLCQFLSSVRIAEHTVPDSAVNKFVKAMDELKDVLHKLGNILITMEHNHILMRTFLNTCCKWGDLYMILSYYSTNVDMSLAEIRKQDHSLSNISYMHSYLTASQWSLISERVKNFGKTACNELMQNLFIQHIKAVLLFENTLNEEMVATLISNFMLSMNDLWYFIIEDSFVLNNIVPKMQGSQIRTLVDMVVSNIPEPEIINKILPKLVNSEVMLKYLVYVILMRINKLMKIKRNSENSLLSTKLFNEFHEIVCLQDYRYDIVDKLLMKFNEEHLRYELCSDIVKINNEKLLEYLKLLTAIPIIYTSDCFRTCTGLYLATVLDDLRYFDKGDIQNGTCLEILLAGILQTTPKHFVSIAPENVIHYFIDNINSYKKIFTYFTQTLYVDNDLIEQTENISHLLMENISDSVKYLDCIGILLNGMIQHKKGKMAPEHKNRITQSILKVSRELTNHIISKRIQSLTLYALILKVTLSQNEDILQLKEHLDGYTEIALNTATEEHNDEGIILLSTILHNKSTFEIVKDDFNLKIWNKYKNAKVPKEVLEERGKLVALVFEHIDNENFKTLTQDLLRSTETSRYSKDDNLFINYIDLWNCIIQSNFNQAKTNTWTQALLTLLQHLLRTLHESDTLIIRKRIIEFEIHVTQTIRVQLTSSILDAILLTISKSISLDCVEIDNLCLKLLDVLLRYRKPIVTDVIPSFLQRYRMLLLGLCKRSNSILDVGNIEELEKSAHCLEMVTKNLIMYGRHVARITPYIIADILKQYENISVIPEVKIHLDNCMYSLLELCDQHAISYLMRSLSTASTELFKFVYQNFNKYYRYKGKV